MYPDPAKKRKRLAVIVVAMVLLGMMIAGVIIFGPNRDKSSGAKRVSDKFVEEVVAGQADDSYQMFSAASKNYTTADTWKQTVSRIKSHYKGEASAVETAQPESTEKSEVRHYNYRIAATDGGNYVLTVFVTNSDGPWQVLQFNSAKESTTK